MKKIIPICMCTDNNFIEYMLVTTTSILENTNKDILFYIITDEFLTNENEDLINRKIQKYKHAKLKIIKIKTNALDKLKTTTHLPISTYYRLLIPKYVFEKKIIYLDGDLILNDDISKLYKINFDSKYMLAVEDLGIKSNYSQHLLSLKLDKYFNAGILVMDLESIKNKKLFEKTIKWISLNPDKITYCDQDGLNVIFKNYVKYIPIDYNYQPTYVYFTKYNLKKSKIIHFAGPKPWKKRFEFNDEKKLYEQYYFKTHNKKLIKKGKNRKFLIYIYYKIKYNYNNKLFNKLFITIEKIYRYVKNKVSVK